MEKIIEYFKKNEFGIVLNTINSLVILVAIIYYLCFSVSANVFQTGILLSFIGALVVSVASFFKIPYVKAYLPILTIFFITLGITLLAMNSVGDITEFFSGVGMYGNRDNVYPRLGIGIVSGIALIVEIVATFFGIEERKAK